MKGSPFDIWYVVFTYCICHVNVDSNRQLLLWRQTLTNTSLYDVEAHQLALVVSQLCHSIANDGVLLFVILIVDEAMKRNKKLTSANEKLEATIVSLKKVRGEVPEHVVIFEAKCLHIS